MQIGRFEKSTTVEGPGNRATIWMQGCSIGCKGCCNPQFINPNHGYQQSVDELIYEIKEINYIEGITILGGEPLDQEDELLKLCQKLKDTTNLGIMLFSGYTWQQIHRNALKRSIINLCDLLIAGPYISEKTPDSRRWVGSTNQTVHFITERYKYLGDQLGPNISEIEFIIKNNEILINGTPLDFTNEIFTGISME